MAAGPPPTAIDSLLETTQYQREDDSNKHNGSGRMCRCPSKVGVRWRRSEGYRISNGVARRKLNFRRRHCRWRCRIIPLPMTTAARLSIICLIYDNIIEYYVIYIAVRFSKIGKSISISDATSARIVEWIDPISHSIYVAFKQ